MLNMNGTAMLDPDTGEEIETYTNEQIISFARAWTGFTMQASRGNVETPNGFLNRIDPMYIIPAWRDIFPKVNMFDGFIGDRYPLCEDLPERSFLRKGAVYRLLGSKSTLELATNPPSTVDSTLIKFTLSSSSELYDKLCNPSSTGGTDCDFESLITLDENLECTDEECDVDTVRQVEVLDDIYYEYVRLSCVELGYYNEAKSIKIGSGSSSICANPNTAVAGEACCDSDRTNTDRSCEYVNERVTFATASQRCSNIAKEICDEPNFLCSSACCDYVDYYFWQSHSCMLYAKVVAESGEIAIVHDFIDDSNRVDSYFSQDTANFFEVYWEGGNYPSPSNNCGGGSCIEFDEYCLCNVTVDNEAVFPEEPTVEEIQNELFIGSVSPDTFDDDVYSDPTNGNVKIHFSTETLDYDMNTIFELSENNKVKYFKNMKSTVRVGEHSFRNPPHFMNFADADARDAHHETDAVLEQYLEHPNVPPFLSKHFLLRFGISNPTPRQVEVVANAFKTGTYVFVVDANESITFGSGDFGDLSAMIAAILLDRETRLLLLDYDPAHGGLKEPLLKVIGLMRSMEYNMFSEFSGTNTLFKSMTSKIDQMAYNFASVFSFFRSDFSPAGPVSQASLVAPEGQRYLAPYVIGLMNGLLSMVRFGLSDCDQGFGAGGAGSCRDGGYEAGQGNLTFIPSDPSDAKTVVDELAIVLTGGRLNSQSREIIQQEFENAESDEKGLKIAEQLIISTPEFHSTSLTEFNGKVRPELDEVEESDREYKALIYLHFHGGLDSYNMIVPHSGCIEKNLYDEYAEIRGNIALDNETLLLIDTGGEQQPCDYFGIHYDLPVLQDLYDDGDLIFFANVGTLFKDVTKADWRSETKTQLFAHNIGTRDAQRIDPMKAYDGTGVFGRMSDVLTANGYNTGGISVASENYILIGEPQASPAPFYVDSRGVKEIFPNLPEELQESINDLNNASDVYSGLYGETWSQTLQNSIFQTELMKEALENATLFNETLFPDSHLGRQFKMVAKAIEGRDTLGLDRCTFYLSMGGFDTHFDQEEILGTRFETISEAFEAFVKEMRGQGMWQNVAIVTSSDFARTITPNGGKFVFVFICKMYSDLSLTIICLFFLNL